MIVNEAPEFHRDEMPDERPVQPQAASGREIETIFCPGDKIAGYEIEKVLGIGSTSVVYGALQLSSGRHVVLKVPLNALSRHPAFPQAFERLTAQLTSLSHPNLVSTIDVGRHGDAYYFVLEPVDGVPLEAAIDRMILSYGDYMTVIRQVRDALRYLHGENIAHLDLRPSNILLGRNGQVKLGDFGLGHIAVALGILGDTPVACYRAPEVLARQVPFDCRADVYSLGILYHRMFSGEFPHNGEARASQINPILPKSIDGVLQEAIARNKEDRFDSVQKMTTELLESLMGMAAFFHLDTLGEESNSSLGVLKPAAGTLISHPPAKPAPPPPPSAVQAPPPAPPQPAAAVPATPDLPLEQTLPPAPSRSGIATLNSLLQSRRPQIVAACAVVVGGFLTGSMLLRKMADPLPAAAPTVSQAAAPAVVGAQAAAKGEAQSKLLEGWIAGSDPRVAQALKAGYPVALYFHRGTTIDWALFESHVLMSPIVQQKLAGVICAMENLDTPATDLRTRYGKGDEPVLTVIGRNGRSIARFDATATADQVAYALSLM